MLIEFTTNGDKTRFINVLHVTMIEPAPNQGTFIHVIDMDKIYTPELVDAVARKINLALRDSAQ